jgi:hypothetical protein
VLELLAGLMTALCVVPYLRDIRRGTTRPHRTSWAVFAIVELVAALGQFASHAWAGAFLALGAAIGFSAVAIASIKYGEGGTRPIDRVAIVVLAVGLVVWALTSNAWVAVFVAMAIDLPAVALTFQKSRRDPSSETLSTWVIDCAAGMVAVLAVLVARTPTGLNLMYPAYHVIGNGCIVAALLMGRRVRSSAVASLAS